MTPNRDKPRPQGASPDGRDKPEAPPKPAEQTQAGPPAQAAPEGAVESALEVRTRECKELVDQLQRLAAEYYNYQKRAARMAEETKRLAIRDLVLDLLPAIDDFERALAAAKANPDVHVLLEGLGMAHAQLLAGLRKHGITPIEAGGAEFDPEQHEAVAHVPSEEHAEGRIVHEVHKGYRFHDWLLRPSRVAVSRGKPAPEAEGEGGPVPDAAAAGDAEDQRQEKQ
jgi:molecular chaperone GrpE